MDDCMKTFVSHYHHQHPMTNTREETKPETEEVIFVAGKKTFMRHLNISYHDSSCEESGEQELINPVWSWS